MKNGTEDIKSSLQQTVTRRNHFITYFDFRNTLRDTDFFFNKPEININEALSQSSTTLFKLHIGPNICHSTQGNGYLDKDFKVGAEHVC